MNCRTCEYIKFYKEDKSDIANYKVFAKISQYGWCKEQKKIKGEQVSEITSRAFDLKYCPTCGRKV